MRINEDASASMILDSCFGGCESLGLFIVANGITGWLTDHSGRDASALAVRTLAGCFIRQVCLPVLAEAATPDLALLLHESMRMANAALLEKVPGCAVSMTAAVVRGDYVYLSHIGETRAYFISQEDAQQVTQDHLNPKQSSEEVDAFKHSPTERLSRGLGKGEHFEAEMMSGDLPAGSYLLLCTAGLWVHVDPATIFEIVSKTPAPSVASNRLVARANQRGGSRNISVVLIQNSQNHKTVD